MAKWPEFCITFQKLLIMNTFQFTLSKGLSFLTFSILFCIFNVSAQPINNSSFENWSNNHFFDEPNGFISTNFQTYIFNSNGNVEKINPAFAGNAHVKLTTVAANNDTIPGAFFLGIPSGNTLLGGVPFTERPDSLVGYARYSILPSDTANMIVLFKSNSIAAGFAKVSFTGSQGSFARFSVPIYWALPQNPDTLSGFVISSNTDYPALPGSTIELDEIGFVGATPSVYPNGDFEAWTPIQSLEPDGWNTINFITLNGTPSVTQSTDAIDGLYSARIETVVTPYGDTLGFMSNGDITSNLLQGGMPVTQNPLMISGFYKYTPVGPDTALIGSFLTKYDNVFGTTVRLDSSLVQLTATTNWTAFSLNFAYNGFPIGDTLNVSIASSNMEEDGNYMGVGSALWIDKLEVFYNPVGEPQSITFNKNTTGIYRDDTGNYYFRQNSNKVGEGTLLIYDGSGRLVHQQQIIKEISQQISYNQWVSGIYSYRFIGEKISSGKFTFNR